MEIAARRQRFGDFRPGGGIPGTPTIDVRLLYAKIRELTLEDDFLEGALIKGGLLSATR
jgi:transposase